jgi:hypothetical protein
MRSLCCLCIPPDKLLNAWDNLYETGYEIMAREPILTAYFINPSHQSVCNPLSLLIRLIVLKGAVGFSLRFIFCMPWYSVNAQYYEQNCLALYFVLRHTSKKKRQDLPSNSTPKVTCQNHWQTRGFSHDWIDCHWCCEEQLDRVAVEQTDFPREPHNDTTILLDWKRCIQSSLRAFHKGPSFMSFWERDYALVDRRLFHVCNSWLTITCKIPYAYHENEDWFQSVTTPFKPQVKWQKLILHQQRAYVNVRDSGLWQANKWLLDRRSR